MRRGSCDDARGSPRTFRSRNTMAAPPAALGGQKRRVGAQDRPVRPSLGDSAIGGAPLTEGSKTDQSPFEPLSAKCGDDSRALGGGPSVAQARSPRRIIERPGNLDRREKRADCADPRQRTPATRRATRARHSRQSARNGLRRDRGAGGANLRMSGRLHQLRRRRSPMAQGQIWSPVGGDKRASRSDGLLDHDMRAEMFVVPDMTQDSRFDRIAMVVGEPHCRFYCGMPLITDEGYALGTLCVLDFEPRRLTFEQMEALRRLSRQVLTLLGVASKADRA